MVSSDVTSSKGEDFGSIEKKLSRTYELPAVLIWSMSGHPGMPQETIKFHHKAGKKALKPREKKVRFGGGARERKALIKGQKVCGEFFIISRSTLSLPFFYSRPNFQRRNLRLCEKSIG